VGLGNAGSFWQVTRRQRHPHSGGYKPTSPLLPPLILGANSFLSFLSLCRVFVQLYLTEYYLRLVSLSFTNWHYIIVTMAPLQYILEIAVFTFVRLFAIVIFVVTLFLAWTHVSITIPAIWRICSVWVSTVTTYKSVCKL
jgi:hypothetical protein